MPYMQASLPSWPSSLYWHFEEQGSERQLEKIPSRGPRPIWTLTPSVTSQTSGCGVNREGGGGITHETGPIVVIHESNKFLTINKDANLARWWFLPFTSLRIQDGLEFTVPFVAWDGSPAVLVLLLLSLYMMQAGEQSWGVWNMVFQPKRNQTRKNCIYATIHPSCYNVQYIISYQGLGENRTRTLCTSALASDFITLHEPHQRRTNLSSRVLLQFSHFIL